MLEGEETLGEGINGLGQVVGWTWSEWISSTGSFLWTEADGMRSLDGVSRESGLALDINDQGQVVGRNGCQAYVWTKAVGMRDLGTLGGGCGGAVGVNNLRQV